MATYEPAMLRAGIAFGGVCAFVRASVCLFAENIENY